MTDVSEANCNVSSITDYINKKEVPLTQTILGNYYMIPFENLEG